MASDNGSTRRTGETTSGLLPVAAGMLAGAGLLAIVAFGRPDAPRTAQVSAVVPAVTAVSPLPERIPHRTADGDRRGIFLPPRAEAADLTRRIENGLPLRDPVPDPEPEKAAPPDTRPRIAIVIDDMGFDAVNSAKAVGLPPAVTLAYLPGAPNVEKQVRLARRKGHAVMLHLPMEAPSHRGRPGRDVLAIADSAETLRRRLVRLLDSFDGYIGVNNHMGSRFTRDRDRMRIVLSELGKRGLFFLDSRTSNRSIGAEIAVAANVPYAVRDVFLDHDPATDKIALRIAEAERLARATGEAVVIAHPRNSTMKMLIPWVRSLEAKGIALVPVTDLLKKPAANRLAQLQSAE